ncbi:hypothetical protein K474DRAFT_1661139 [Panus rudis PR-1116 ss-1]|nr:hypothetical protein K474DRAFT_1661139 [Panus rudis PR-1116 ss-1]
MGSGFMSPPIQSQPTGMPFQPSSSFGQQLQGAMNGGYGGMLQQQQQQPQQYSGYPTQYGQMGYGQPPQQQQPQNTYLPEFDPLANSTSGPTSSQAQTQGNSQYQTAHPRDFIRQHKAELEAWDPYYWKQALNAFDSLKEAWGARKRDIEARARSFGGAGLFSGGGYGGPYGGQGQEVARLEQLAKEAGSNFDSVAASTFQMQEVFAGYRQSGDMASKRRVRECVNAALASLPHWPPQYL